jgi:hypothetical protein
MGPKNQRSAPRRSESVPNYDDARNCVLNDTQTMDQTSDLPRNHNEAEVAYTERETQSSSSSSSSVTEEPVIPGTGSRYRDMFNMPEVPPDQPAQNVADNPSNQNIDQPVVAPDIIQMGNVVAPESAIKKRHTVQRDCSTWQKSCY